KAGASMWRCLLSGQVKNQPDRFDSTPRTFSMPVTLMTEPVLSLKNYWQPSENKLHWWGSLLRTLIIVRQRLMVFLFIKR
ncbi:MAG: hypothetical protein ACSLE5_09245, partial [Porticoccaceae bacterium]